MPHLHLICKDRLHVTPMREAGPNVYESGYWPVTEEDAVRLIGGILYLHEAKADRSYFGGNVVRFRRAGGEWPEAPERLIFTILATHEAKEQRWRGREDPMAWVGGVLDD